MKQNECRPSLFIVLLIAFLLVSFAKVRHTASDPRASLLVSQAIVKHGTIKLDHYGSEVLQRYGYTIQQKNNHFYYYFPLGSSLLSVPFVAVANGWGLDMVQAEPALQIAIASISALATILLLFRLGRLFLPYRESVVLAALFWFGTSFASTTGTALWSHNFATVFSLLALYLAIKFKNVNDYRRYTVIAASLFVAYLCRPTMALLAPFVILYLFSHEKKGAIKATALLVLLLVFFAAFSQREFGQILPDYYLPKRLEGGHVADALYGNLFSPARGLLIFSPFLFLPLLVIKRLRDVGKDRGLLLLALAWPVAHLVFVSRFPHWWAGWSFGARLMTDVLPGLFVLLCYTVSAVQSNLATWVFLAATGLFSVFVNSYQGLYNEYTAQWNVDPNIDKYPEYLFDWRYPQFLHNRKRHESRLADYQQTQKDEALARTHSGER